VSGRSTGAGGWTTSWATLVAVLVLYFAVPLEAGPSPARLVVGLALTLGAVGWVALVVLREFRRQVTGTEEGLRGRHLALLLELALVLFALAYYLLAIHGTDQMVGIGTRLDALYFTASTMATVGYGDVHPAGQVARGVATAHIVFDVVFLGLVARLVGRALTRPAPGADA
jgi:voltage-gated potassium channel